MKSCVKVVPALVALICVLVVETNQVRKQVHHGGFDSSKWTETVARNTELSKTSGTDYKGGFLSETFTKAQAE